ncbi:zinc finger protein 723-like [Ochlerotatus camptorhynchus]|uniref:zinc finger protein 723-like n=1 Tax=Ochlerotatus camptorhynchus TaxID=644619 RepID=UPI0031DBDF51
MATMIVIRKGKSSRSICRLCFMEREQHQPIFGSDYPSLDEWIGSLISLKIVDAPNAPASLCFECKATLEDFESFIEMCRTNDCVFNEMFLQNGQTTKRSDPQQVPAEREIKDSAENDNRMIDPVLPFNSSANIKYQNVEEVGKTSIIQKPTGEEQDHVKLLNETDKDESIQPKRGNNASRKKRKNERCRICKMYFNDIDEHMLTHNETYQCELCPKAFAKMSLLRTHIYRHKLQRKYFCKECGSGFKYPIDLKNHIRIHTQEKPFKCKDCGLMFRTRTNMNRHAKVHKELSHACQHCRTRFTSAEGLERHKRQIVRDKYWCKVCKKDFSTCDHLVYHRKTENH